MAAGLGFKTFTTGEVLTANDTNGYLMQGVLVFASSAARASAITSPQEGQYSYLKDTNSTEYYDGAAWIAAPIGDITGVTAGTGISGGGTSGTVTITNDMATTITAAGDIVVGTGSGTYDNLPIGTTAQVLTADTTVSPYKVKWATPAVSSSALTLISTTTLSAVSSQSFNSVFTSTYTNYQIAVNLSSTGSVTDYLRIRFRASGTDATSGYQSRLQSLATNAAGTTSFDYNVQITTGINLGFIKSNGTDPQLSGLLNITNPQVAQTSGVSGIMTGGDYYGVAPVSSLVMGILANTTAYDGFTLYPSGGGNLTGTVSIYGLAK